jgi:hypothetical protein
MHEIQNLIASVQALIAEETFNAAPALAAVRAAIEVVNTITPKEDAMQEAFKAYSMTLSTQTTAAYTSLKQQHDALLYDYERVAADGKRLYDAILLLQQEYQKSINGHWQDANLTRVVSALRVQLPKLASSDETIRNTALRLLQREVVAHQTAVYRVHGTHNILLGTLSQLSAELQEFHAPRDLISIHETKSDRAKQYTKVRERLFLQLRALLQATRLEQGA